MAWFGQYLGTTYTGQWWGECGAAAVVVGQQGGRVKPIRRRKRHYVEIDGQYYEVRDLRHAEEVLAALREKALAKIKVGKRRAKAVAPRIAVVEPAHAELFTQALQAKVDAANAKLALAFGEAMRAADALAARIAADDEEALMLITTGLV